MRDQAEFNPIAKLFYRPIEAAIRWCDLIDYEAQILEVAFGCPGRHSQCFSSMAMPASECRKDP